MKEMYYQRINNVRVIEGHAKIDWDEEMGGWRRVMKEMHQERKSHMKSPQGRKDL